METNYALLALLFVLVFGYLMGRIMESNMLWEDYPGDQKKAVEDWVLIGIGEGAPRKVKFKGMGAFYETKVEYMVWRSGDKFKINIGNADIEGTLPSEITESSDAEILEFLLDNYTPGNQENVRKSTQV